MNAESVFMLWTLVIVALAALAIGVWVLALAHKRFVDMHDVWVELRFEKAISSDDEAPMLGITVRNRSLLPVTIVRVNLALKASFKSFQPTQFLIYRLPTFVGEDRELPILLPQRSQAQIRCALAHPDFRRKVDFLTIQVLTACGHTIVAGDEELRRLLRVLAAFKSIEMIEKGAAPAQEGDVTA